ncbi:MAG: T9SS type A sorting domain-containing protein [Chitinophagales bacterium]
MKKILLLSLLIALASFANAQKVTTFSDPELIPINLVRISPAIRDIPQTPPTQEELNAERVEHENPSLEHPFPRPNPDALPQGADPAVQTSYAKGFDGLTSATILSNWEGLTANVDPSDNTLAVGQNHVMQMTNNNSSTYIRIWDKSGNILVNNTKVSSITGISDLGDPNLIYDHAAKRYVLLVLYSFSQNKLVVCVSQTSDPTGAYYVYTFTTTNGFPDYPKIGVWGNSYFITTNSNSPTIFALKRSDMLDGVGTGTVQAFTLAGFPSVGFEAAAPVHRTGSKSPPSGEKAMVIRVADDAWGGSVGSDHLEIFKIKINWNNSASSSITGPFSLPILPFNSNLCGFNSLSCIPQPGTTTKLDPLGGIVMDKVQYRNMGNYESIVLSHVCNSDGNGTAGVRWYELRKDANGEWYIYQEGTYSPDTDSRFMSSISINKSGAIALGYNISSSSVFPGIRITGRDTCDALNTMSVAETVVKAGSSRNASNRYGDYNAMVADPKDGSFWMTANYNVTTDWTTNVVHFTLDPCPLRVAASAAVINNLLAKPNPASSEVTLSFVSSIDKDVKLQIVNMVGKVVLEQSQQVVSGLNETTLDVRHLENGYYFVKVLALQGEVVQKLVIQR